jgi:hypothetical protein
VEMAGVGGVIHRGGRRYLEGWEAVATSRFSALASLFQPEDKKMSHNSGYNHHS